MTRVVREIPATISRFTASPINEKRKRRVAGYARVSTDQDDQMTSYEAQVDYYTNYIQSRADWDFVGMYTDEGISGTNTRHREGFKRMVDDALDGKIDLIVTKSVSRFARNTVDSLSTVRKLKDRGVEIYFEKENIWTLDAKGELLITIMSSLAQEESRSISENVTWAHRKRFADGKVTMCYSRFLGYEKGADAKPVINPEEAKTVKLIYKLFLQGLSSHSIAKKLMEMKKPAPAGGMKWYPGTIRRILRNEKYKGDALLQKEFTVDFLTKKTKKNEGEVPQYYVENSHEAIIEPRVFDWVQQEFERRKNSKKRYSGVSIFSSKIKCGQCGGWFGSKVWHSTDKYRRTIYRCNDKFDHGCDTPHLTEDEIKTIFVKAVNQLVDSKDSILFYVRKTLSQITNMTEMESKRDELQNEMNRLVNKVQALIAENARRVQDQDEYNRKYENSVDQYEEAKSEYEILCGKIEHRKARVLEMETFLNNLQKQEQLVTFDENVWCSLVNFITVYSKEDVRVMFKDGTEITV